ncbi:MAG: A/G-specific adenine glycosylase [Caulobacterales bacterium]|uniref:A/G-specific adenine glycosylase n=1 Tax=Glycocaulis sp. TaxID=1969725 RepID=UPI003F9EE62E
MREIEQARARLLAWYDAEGRSLPWRIRPEEREAGCTADPYAVWLSEIMLQQTTVAHAAPYYAKFLSRWPGVHDLAAAPREAVMAEWAGLGYYARARNLHACAIAVSSELGGIFPSSLEGLRALPGIGEYTAHAIRAAAFNLSASVVDANVERVITRMFRIDIPLPKAKPQIRAYASSLADPDRPGDYAQAIMDLGAVICTPRAPACDACPWSSFCAARAAGDAERFPVKLPKAAKPIRHGLAFVALRGAGQAREVLVRTRPDKGLLGGMLEVPGTHWVEDRAALPSLQLAAPFAGDWQAAGAVRHVFTHFELHLQVLAVSLPEGAKAPEGMAWVKVHPIRAAGLPTVMKKAVQVAL